MTRIDPREERERFRRQAAKEGPDEAEFDVKDVLVEARVDAAPRVLRAQVRYWQSMYELERERLLKLWLLYEDAEGEVAELKGQMVKLEERGEYAKRILRAAMSKDDGAQSVDERFAPDVRQVFDRFDEASGATPEAPVEAEPGGDAGSDPFRYGPYTLYKLDVPTAGGGAGQFYFFARGQPKRGSPSPLPEACDVALNPVNGLPYLKKRPA